MFQKTSAIESIIFAFEIKNGCKVSCVKLIGWLIVVRKAAIY